VPTLTVSRLKALTQGTSQSFLDAWLNVANSPDAIRLEGEDTWLSRLKAERGLKKKLVYYGIDVWLDLYPDIFDRHEGFFSFYIPVSLSFWPLGHMVRYLKWRSRAKLSTAGRNHC